MAGRILDEDIALVRERSPVADIVGEHLALRQAGGDSLMGLCPFHDEKSTSFHVTPSRGVWHCFGCGTGGDVIRFVELIDQLSFVEAVERLAARAGVELRYQHGSTGAPRRPGQRIRLIEAHRRAQHFYAEALTRHEARPAREFLLSRGFDAEAAARYGCGYAPAGWEELTKHLLSQGFSQDELVAAGLARKSPRSGVIDRFHRRLLWPIRDITGDVIGFGARRLYEDDHIEAKYLNTPETPIFKKSHVLYGVDLAKRDIARRHQAVIVEGYTDVMACHLAGVPTAVATCGTAFGDEHITILRRLLMDQDEFLGEVIFTFDGDAAGQKAALRAFEDDQRFVMQTFVAVEPSGMDPCDLRQAKGDAAVRDLIARRQPLFAFALRAALARYNLDTAEGRVQALERAAPLVARIKDRALRPEYARRLAGELGMEVEPVLARVAELARGGRASRPVRQRPPEVEVRPRPEDPRYFVEREVLKLAMQRPTLAGPLFDAVDQSAFTHPSYAMIRQAISAAGNTSSARSGPEWVERVSDECPDLVVRSVVSELAVERMRTSDEPDSRYAAEQLARLQELAVTRQIAELKSTLQRTNPLEQPEKHTKLFGELVALEQYKRGLRERGIETL